MESRRMHTDSVRKAGEFNTAFGYTSTNGAELLKLRGSAVMQVKSKSYKDLWLFAGNYDLAKAQEQSFQNAAFLHFRYNRTINRILRWEAFTQVQNNQPLDLELRFLAGSGPRFKIKLWPQASLYLATAYMAEYEALVDQPSIAQWSHRNSSYASLSIGFQKIKGDLVSTTYYQPLFADISDYRISSATRFSFNLTDKLTLFTRINFFFDSRPPQNIEQSTKDIEQGFGWKF